MIHAPIMFAINAIDELVKLATQESMVDSVCCKRISTKEAITQERLNKMGAISKDMQPMVGYDMPALRKYSGALQNPRGLTSIICQRSVCKEVI